MTTTHRSGEHDRGLLVPLAANATLITALMFYMGWAYMNSWLGYFNVGAFSVGFTVPEFVLESLSLFSPGLIVAGAAVAVAAGARSWVPVPRPIRCYLLRSGKLARPVGLALSAAGVILAVLAYHVRINTYLVVFFIGSGLLLSRWPGRTAGNLQPAADRIARIAAVLITGSCAFWTAALLASAKGTDDAAEVACDLPDRTAVAVYSPYRLALSGPGLHVEQFPADEHYRYRYIGLRLLLARPDRYFVLPVGWRHGIAATYVINMVGDTRVELLPGARS